MPFGLILADGSLVAGYEMDGLNSFYHDDDMRNRVEARAGGAHPVTSGTFNATPDALRDY
jgi:hypothetical protein